jgi:anti-anti-sigma factor
MKIETSRQGNIGIVTLSGRMDGESAPQFEKICEDFLKDGVTRLVVGLGDLQYVSSMGLRSFLILAKQTQSKGGSMALCGMKGFVKEVFDMTHVTQLFPLFDTVDAAIPSA